MSNQRIKTPCVGLCSTVYGDLVCRGCKRFHHEVVNWNLYREEEKRAVLLRLESLLVQVMAAKLEVFDPALLRQQLEQRQIRFAPQQSPYCWAYLLIARGARLIQQLDAYGIVLLGCAISYTILAHVIGTLEERTSTFTRTRTT